MKSLQYAIGIIIGGTNTSIGLVSSAGKIIAQRQLKTNTAIGFERSVQSLCEITYKLTEEKIAGKGKLTGIGIGCTGPVDPVSGTIITDFTLPGWGGKILTEPFQALVKKPVVLENNVDMSAYGEYFLDEQQPSPLLLLTFGTGVGGGVILNGQIYRGANGEHPEIGHLPVREDGPDCYCGIKGCLEMAASGTGLAIAAKSIGLNSAEDVFREAAAGHSGAKAVLEESIDCMSRGLWALLHTFMPQVIILGGGVMEGQYPLLFPYLEKTLGNTTMVPIDKVILRKGQPNNDAGLVGAAMWSLKLNNIPPKHEREH